MHSQNFEQAESDKNQEVSKCQNQLVKLEADVAQITTQLEKMKNQKNQGLTDTGKEHYDNLVQFQSEVDSKSHEGK